MVVTATLVGMVMLIALASRLLRRPADPVRDARLLAASMAEYNQDRMTLLLAEGWR